MKNIELNLVEEHLNSNNSPFRFNPKELDCLSREAVRFGKETGNYYYGARYYDPKWSIWLSVDPLAEKYPSISSYAYVANNPLRYIDPDGMRIDDSYIYETNDDGTFKNPELVEAFEFFAGTKEGKDFLSKYAEKGQTIGGVTFDEDGEFHQHGIDLTYNKDLQNNTKDGYTSSEFNDSTERFNLTVFFGESNGTVYDMIDTITHESLIHVDYFTEDILQTGKQDNSNIDKYIIDNYKFKQYHHFQIKKDQRSKETKFGKEGYNIMKQANKRYGIHKSNNGVWSDMWGFID